MKPKQGDIKLICNGWMMYEDGFKVWINIDKAIQNYVAITQKNKQTNEGKQ